MSQLREFVRESNRIEGILRDPTDAEVEAHAKFLRPIRLGVNHFESFVFVVAQAPLRDKPGMDVRVGSHFPPRGGPEVRDALRALLEEVAIDAVSPYEAHVAYETLHPFLDGNGRSGRALWTWQMQSAGQDPFALPFLHRFYYQTLDAHNEQAEEETT